MILRITALVVSMFFVTVFTEIQAESRQYQWHRTYSTLTNPQPPAEVSRLQRSEDTEFSPDLYGGNTGNPGIKVKVNQKGFAYVGKLLGDIADKEIRTARLPIVRQCIPQLSGCITVYNMYMARYRCAQRVIAYPSPPNRINIAVENFDISVAGNLGGQIVVLLPIALSGIVYLNAHQLSIILQVDVVPSPAGKPLVRVSGCSANVGYVDTYVQNAGLVGDIVNNQFRSKISEKMRQMLPKKLCEVVPRMLNQKVNQKLSELPTFVDFAKIQSLAKSLLGDAPDIPQYCFSSKCQSYLKNHTSSSGDSDHRVARRVSLSQQLANLRGRREVKYINIAPRAAPIQDFRDSSVGQFGNDIGASGFEDERCEECPTDAMIKDPLQAARVLMQAFNKNFDRIADITFSSQLQHTYATANDYTIDFNGGFSPANSALPFGAFPLYFPKSVSNRMVEILISDFTLNSLFYSMHKKNFFSFRVGPETPKIGPLLRTSCSEDESDEELEDHGVELDDEDVTTKSTFIKMVRRRRQTESEEEGGLASLGICFGDIVPSVREDHPNKNVYIIINSIEAPSVIFSDEKGGSAKIETKSDAVFYIAETNEKVGVVSIDMGIQVSLHLESDRIKGSAEITTLKLVDKEQTLGLPQDAMDNLATLGKEMLAKVANDAFSKGIKVKLALPKSSISPENSNFRLIQHALYIETDISVPQAALEEIGVKKVCLRRS